MVNLERTDNYFNTYVRSQLIHCLTVYRTQLSMCWPDFLVGDDSLFEMLNGSRQSELDLFWDEFEDPNDEQLFLIQQGWCQLPLDVQKTHTADPMDEMKSNGNFGVATFEYITSYVMGRAFRNYLKAQLHQVLDALQEKAIAARVPHTSAAFYEFLAQNTPE